MEQEINYEEFGPAPGRGEAASYGLILAAQNGNRKAFQELVREFEAIVMRVALNITGSQEAAQEIYCQVFKDAFISLNQLCSGSSVFIWIYRLLARRCVEYSGGIRVAWTLVTLQRIPDVVCSRRSMRFRQSSGSFFN